MDLYFWNILINGLGLCLDIWGTIMIFSKLKTLDEIEAPSIRRDWDLNNMNFNNKIIYEYLNSLSETVSEVKRNNDSAFKESKKWFYMIIIGFFLQLLSIFFTPFTNLKSTSEANNNATYHC